MDEMRAERKVKKYKMEKIFILEVSLKVYFVLDSSVVQCVFTLLQPFQSFLKRIGFTFFSFFLF